MLVGNETFLKNIATYVTFLWFSNLFGWLEQRFSWVDFEMNRRLHV